MKTHHFHTKLPYQKPMLRQINWWLQNGPITKNGVLTVATLFFLKFCFSLRTSYKELICCANNPNVHVCTFCKRWSFIWQCFFSGSILKYIFLTEHFPVTASTVSLVNTSIGIYMESGIKYSRILCPIFGSLIKFPHWHIIKKQNERNKLSKKVFTRRKKIRD